MIEERKADMCRNFREYSEAEVDEDANLIFGDGECPAEEFVINGDHKCLSNCMYFEELKIK
jgi:hypothetical protein